MIPSAKDIDNLHMKVISLLEEAYACRINNLKRSTQLAKKALAISRKLKDKALLGKCLSHLSLFFMVMGEYKLSMAFSKEAIEYFEELHDEKGVADAKYSLAGVYYKTDNYHLGLVYLFDCLSIYRKFNDYHNQARVQKSLGTIFEYFGDEKNAVKSYESAIEAAKIVGDINLESNAYNPLSGIYLNRGDIKKALELIEKSMMMKKQTGDIRGLAFALYGRGKIYIKTKQYEEAERDFQESIRIHKEMGERLGLGMAYYKMGALYIEMNHLEKAKEILRKALEFSGEYNIALVKVKCDYLFYQIYKRENNPVLSLEYLEAYHSQKDVIINAQTQMVIENYELITKMESLAKETQLQQEKGEIMEKKNRAEQTARVKQDFLSTMSHEIRTPLNAVITIASLLRDKSDEVEKPLVEALKFAANNLLLIINDILDFTKLDSGNVYLEKRPVNFMSLLENIKNTYESLADEKGLKLILNIDPDVYESFELDETKISQIMGNLITNAIKYTEKGQVEIRIEKIESDQDQDLLRFKIIDTGIGIGEQYLDDIFDSFSQPPSITTRKQGGSGLGLAIVKKLVALHGNEVYVESELRKGSVFYFDLKLKRSILPVPMPLTNLNQLRGKTVLLAEDNTINAMVAIKLLSNWEIVTELAKNGLEAVEKANRKGYDFILMDLHMPEMDGFEATKQVRKNEGPNMNTPIFALTADITAEQHMDYNSYFNGFLLKPMETDKLYEVLVNVL
jgi:signal transduction histidine kinase/Tfp pilus assembly protein PilF